MLIFQKSAKIKKTSMANIPLYDWLKIKTDYFTDRMATLEDIAIKYGVPTKYLHNKAGEEKWREEKDQIWTKAGNKVVQKLPETIAQIKSRHVQIARAMQAKMIEKIKNDKIVSKSTFSDLKTAIDIERDALGFNDKKQTDEVYEKFSQFNFIFALKPDELRRFIESAITRAGITGGGNGTVLPQGTGEGEERKDVGTS